MIDGSISDATLAGTPGASAGAAAPAGAVWKDTTWDGDVSSASDKWRIIQTLYAKNSLDKVDKWTHFVHNINRTSPAVKELLLGAHESPGYQPYTAVRHCALQGG